MATEAPPKAESRRQPDVCFARADRGVIGDVLVVAPSLVPVTVGDDGIVTANGFVHSTGELWSTSDGTSWVRVLQTRDEISAIAGQVTEDGLAVGVWMRLLRSGKPESVETTMAYVPPQDLDQAVSSSTMRYWPTES